MPETPRIAYQDLPEPLAARLRPRVDRLGYLGEFFQVAGHQPDALAGFVDFTEALKVALPDRLVEVIALTVASATGNDYERVQHERLALRVGLDAAEVRRLTGGAALDDRFSDLEAAAAALARCVVDACGRSCEESYARVELLSDAATAVGCLMTAARYLAHATMANTWGLRPPVTSPLDSEEAHV